MSIIHLSDVHFGNPEATFNPREVAHSLSDFINNRDDDLKLVVSGDITFRGRCEGYEQAKEFFKVLFENSCLQRGNIIACPGNHDISSNGFRDFDAFMYSIRRDENLCFSTPGLKVVEFDSVVFFVINTVYHLNHRYGLVDNNILRKDVKGCFDGKVKILVLHHNILNQFHDDTSTIRNSYDLVQWIVSNGISTVIHGHQHADQEFTIGNNGAQVFSVRSGNYLQAGHMNAFNYYSLYEDNTLRRKAFVFETLKGSVGIKELV
ncbi:metallophosphoesterase family protein [Larsenimonas rhizosphaerae]|uniref:Metallophosphoesterase n=1 Tax=Larsenimonas rhizosphaerae TaxID=2944682 RepID=A0AA41ZEL9_9GAMM|nr:metallophosphoesterase [Larsenimonas rhizosphaerae]MCX2522734.1 metallophosphoesterase [Larsenimonas rhizosphaerae]